MIFYFSGTGNSAWVAHQLAEVVATSYRAYPYSAVISEQYARAYRREKVYAIPEALRTPQVFSLSPDEPLGFVFPVYAWGPPTVVLRFLQQLQLSLKPSYIYFVCTCGDDTGRTAQVFSKAVRRKGWTCAAGWSVRMPNTYVSLPGFDIDDKDTEQQKLQHAQERVRFIAGELASRVVMKTYNCYEGAWPFTKTYVLRPLFQTFLMSPQPFHCTQACVGCGKCVRVCPMQNIRWHEGHLVWGTDCAHCLACYHVCPKHAVAYGQRTSGKGQYRHFL